jgi:hypothetical protein
MKIFSIGLSLVLAVALCSMAFACPNCKNALAENASGGELAQGFYWSILFMMSMPFALVAGFGGYMFLEVRRAKRLGFYDDPVRKSESVNTDAQS